MEKSVSAIVVILFLCALASAQNTKSTAKPDFTGTWLLDTRKRNTRGLTTRPDLPMTISHRDPDFKMVISSESNGQITKHEFTYFTDERGETNEATSVITTNPSAVKPKI